MLFSYLVDGRGVREQAVVSSLPGVSNVSYLKFSPAGDRIAFTGMGAPGQPVIGVADFDQATGQASNLKLFPSTSGDFHRAIEFSGNGKVLYFSSGVIRLTQYDLTQPTGEQIARSAVVLAESPIGFFHAPQLAIDGKIYISESSSNQGGRGGLAVIEHPNVLGPACSLRLNAVPGYGALVLPNFVTSFLYRNDTLALNLEAGPDQRVCGPEPVRLGGRSSPALSYRWSPGSFLSDSTSPTPTFQYPGPVEQEMTLQYVLTASDGPCARRDTVRVTVCPIPSASLSGTRSVCPRVEGVEYRVEEPVEGHAYRWQVSGGTLTSGQGTAMITVDWGPTNAQAWVEAVPVNPQGCEGPAVRLPVRINVELIPETPRGPEAVCLNQRQGITYSVTNTPGSIYTWSVEGGTLASGQGSSRVTVDWQGEGHHKLWLQEQSTTRDTVCFGVSEPLLVSVFRDRTALSLSRVSMSLEQEGAVEAFWSSSDPARTAEPLVLLRRRKGENGWQQAASLPRGSTSHQDPNLRTHEQVYEYRVEAQNGCGELIGTSAHATVLLTGEGREEDGQISLSWTGYEGWEQGVERYEVWRKLDGEEQLRLVGQVNGSTLTYSGASGLDGFDHRFRIRAIAKGTGLVSWSNELQLEFKHELTAPNIFTPNGDGYNDTFSIPLLELYPDNQLTVFSRWGQVVYQAENYRNGWTAERLSAGTYYYSLLLRRNGKLLKGWVEVLR
jgi:gliding motility-associated-like protein